MYYPKPDNEHYRIFILLIILSTQSWSMVTVGSSPGNGNCTFANIQDALDSNDSEIRILNNQDFIANLNVDHSVNIRGGYASCQDAANGMTDTSNTVIKGTSVVGAAVMTITTSSDFVINLYNLTLQDAVDTIFVTNGGHGINVLSSSGSLTLWDMVIRNNTSEKGGGIYMGDGSNSVNLNIRDSEISGNSASIMGGGVYCEGGDTTNNSVKLIGDSVIFENTAVNGGGAAIINNCSAFFYSGLEASDSIELYGIIGNHATQSGGGLYLDNVDYVNIGYPLITQDLVKLATVKNNTAVENGAGIYAINNSYVLINDAYIDSNLAGNNGGGIYISSGTLMYMSPVQSQCTQFNKCSILSNNKSGTSNYGGGIYINGDSNVNIWNTFIYGNRADYGTAVYVSDTLATGSNLSLEGNYVYENGDNGSGDYQDRYVVRGNGDVEINILHNTVTDNNVNDANAIIGVVNGVTMSLKNSIIHNANETVLSDAGVNLLDNRCLMVNEDTSISGIIVLSVTTPKFVDAINNDYHLTTSGIDWCNPHGGFIKDTDNDIRGWDDPTTEGILAYYDVGADESYDSDIVFKNNFE